MGRGDRVMAKTVQELIELLETVEDKTQVINVWDTYGYCGTNLTITKATHLSGEPLVIESTH